MKMTDSIQTTMADLQTMLKQGIVKVAFQKKDGSRREMDCTLHQSHMPPVDPNKKPSTRTPNPDMVSVIDIANAGWRGFMIDQLLDEPVMLEVLD
jgi:hypothetical protein